MKKILIGLTIILIILFLGRGLNPFEGRMFEFHDETQPARIQQFVLNLQHMKIPPRIAPDFSFKLGYPVFNFYAPTAYWITSIIHMVGINITNTIKLSFLFALVTSFIFSFLFFRKFFSFFSSLIGSVFYITTLYFAIDIFIRGNLAETWFLSLFPAALYFLFLNSEKPSAKRFLSCIVVLAALLSVHNILSLISLPIIILFILLLPSIKRNITALILGILLCSYFFIPLFGEYHLTYASTVARGTDYSLHFLCPDQLWQSKKWEFGASIAGCNDGMPFKIGKINVIMGIVGIIFFAIRSFMAKKNTFFRFSLFFLGLTILSLFFTTYQSKPLWDLTSFASGIIQFPWRFIAFSLLGIGFFTAYFWNYISIPFKPILIIFIIFAALYTNKNYFYREPLKQSEFQHRYTSDRYIEKKVAYKISEYLPKTVDYLYWLRFNNTNPEKDVNIPFDYNIPVETSSNMQLTIIDNSLFDKKVFVAKKGVVKINIHYFPFWKIIINNTQYIPKQFDRLGRPIINITSPSEIRIRYEQTPLEQVGNWISGIIIIFLASLSYKPLWKKVSKYMI